MSNASKCFCAGYGKYTDYNCGASFDVSCPHCCGTGTQKCNCTKLSSVCATFGRGQEIALESRQQREREDDDPHWMFMD